MGQSKTHTIYSSKKSKTCKTHSLNDTRELNNNCQIHPESQKKEKFEKEKQAEIKNTITQSSSIKHSSNHCPMQYHPESHFNDSSSNVESKNLRHQHSHPYRRSSRNRSRTREREREMDREVLTHSNASNSIQPHSTSRSSHSNFRSRNTSIPTVSGNNMTNTNVSNHHNYRSYSPSSGISHGEDIHSTMNSEGISTGTHATPGKYSHVSDSIRELARDDTGQQDVNLLSTSPFSQHPQSFSRHHNVSGSNKSNKSGKSRSRNSSGKSKERKEYW